MTFLNLILTPCLVKVVPSTNPNGAFNSMICAILDQLDDVSERSAPIGVVLAAFTAATGIHCRNSSICLIYNLSLQAAFKLPDTERFSEDLKKKRYY